MHVTDSQCVHDNTWITPVPIQLLQGGNRNLVPAIPQESPSMGNHFESFPALESNLDNLKSSETTHSTEILCFVLLGART